MNYLEFKQSIPVLAGLLDTITEAQFNDYMSLKLNAVYENDGVTLLGTNSEGFYELEDGETYKLSIQGIDATATNAPVVNSVVPAFTGGTEHEVQSNMIEIALDGATGENEHTINITWDDGNCIRTGSIELNFEIV